MICYRDMTFCISANCKCNRKLTQEIKDAAIKWWNSKDAPISVAYLCESELVGVRTGTIKRT